MNNPLDGSPAPLSRLVLMINLVGVALLTIGMAGEAHLGLAGRHLVALLLVIVADGAWLVWAAARYWGFAGAPTVAFAALVVMEATGGALTVFAALSVAYIAIASMHSAIRWNLERAAVIAATGPVVSLVCIAIAGHSLDVVPGVIAGSLAGAVIGMGRRDSEMRNAQAASIQIAEARAEVLAARNHLARELHDVLAHTLAALSLQLQALDALIADGRPVDPEVSDQLDQIKRLVRDGLDEARGAVQALREDVPALEIRLAKLADERNAALEVQGEPRDLPPDVSLALYRVAQEALTNVMKHAPGATAELRLDYADKMVGLSISNPTTTNGDSPLAATGSGYGIQGIKERVLLLGGNVDAGPSPKGWLVSARVPA